MYTFPIRPFLVTSLPSAPVPWLINKTSGAQRKSETDGGRPNRLRCSPVLWHWVAEGRRPLTPDRKQIQRNNWRMTTHWILNSPTVAWSWSIFHYDNFIYCNRFFLLSILSEKNTYKMSVLILLIGFLMFFMSFLSYDYICSTSYWWCCIFYNVFILLHVLNFFVLRCL